MKRSTCLAKRLFAAMISCCWFLPIFPTSAQQPSVDVTIDLQPAPGAADRLINQQPGTTPPQAETLLGAGTNEIAGQLQQVAKSNLEKINTSGLIRSNALAQAIGSTSYLADYGSNMDFFSIGLVNTFGLNNANLSELGRFNPGLPTSTDQPMGLTWNMGLVGGINLQWLPIPSFGLFDLKKLMIFFNGSTFDTGTILQNTSYNYWMAGGYLMYRLIDNFTLIPGGILRWGGLRVGTGLQMQSTNLKWQSPIRPQPQVSNTLGTSPTSFNVVSVVDGNLAIDLNLRTYTIPIEVSSNLQVAHFFTVFGGLSMDIYTGDSTLTAQANSKVNGYLDGDRNAPLYQGQANVKLKQTTPANIGAFRLMAGGQFNMGLVGLFAQINYLFDYSKPETTNSEASSFAFASGLRFFF